MSTEFYVVIGTILLAFGALAVALAWADYQTRDLTRP
jgi:hypothetical protein